MKEQIEKQAIEEMARIICRGKNCKSCVHSFELRKCGAQEYAERLYNAGYRKQIWWTSAENPPETYRDEYGELIPFLVCCRNTEYPFRAVYDGTTWGDGIGRLKVTHWMPLPEPPKVVGNDKQTHGP